ncbi:MAG: NADH:ubiquinone reductase (Na(+)-transporting) subunit D [Exilispira sp.]|jgi:Na+-transporting NADH:ubiquinone oxidoreductase subunit D|nr:NADH:ubiquinone reductase (Na(+)-transporting) subunit D [Exilispira sp.]
MVKKNNSMFKENIITNNPILVQVLGICSTLAVTNSVKNTIVMCIGLIFTVSLSSFSLSIIRKLIPSKVRMIIEVLVISFWVIIVDLVLKAYLPEISKQLGPYVGLIITNCIVMGRTEAFGLQNPPIPSFLDGLTSGLGYSIVLIFIAIIRELLGAGSIYGFKLLGSNWVSWNIMIMAPGAFFLLALIIWIVKGYFLTKIEKK